jgi:D-alanyl-D-alanine carboxypeptidase (penicillin-binding protein 5/6)
MKTSGRRGGNRFFYLIAIIIVLLGYGAWCLLRPLPDLPPTTTALAHAELTTASKLNWPAQGQSAVGLVGLPVLETQGSETPVPTASTAKLITALTVLQKKPLQPDQPGPTITLTAADVALYNNYAAQDGSVVQVQAGEQISEYQMLQTMMLPSANNMADSLAIWTFGSLAAYQQAAAQYLQSVGLADTHVGSDASGLSPSTTSTAHDLVKIGELAMQNPVLAQIVGQSTATGIPVVGTIKNVNSLLGTDSIVGVKTGNSDQAGGVFVAASQITVNNKPVTIVTALAASPSLFQSMKDSLTLMQSAQNNFSSGPVVKASSVVGNYTLPWGGRVSAVAAKTLVASTWNGSTPSPKVTLRKIPASSSAGTTVGSINLPKSTLSSQASTPITLQSAPTKPPISWRLEHPI